MLLNSPVGMSRAFVLVVISIFLQNKVHQSFRNLCVLLYSTYILTTKSSNFDIVPRQIVMYCMYYTGIIHVLYNTSTFFEKILKVWEERKNESKLHETASVECFQITGNRCCKMNPNYRTL